ncbi:purine nucleoside permease [Hydrocarboniphaga sp.]|uniref:purine nucleoside permease n=1 Tax=Hydrocarboniphaga sp. TaxID=2033016 RepID=UPI003453DCDB
MLIFGGCVKKAPAPITVRVVVVSMFEIGKDSGDTAGEFQLWYERQKLTQPFPFAHHHDLYLNPQTGVLGMVTGMGTANSATAVMALGLDPRFDLSHAYWLVAGIAGFDPADASLGSAAWAEYLVDGDLAHEIDAREMPADWPTGYFARGSKRPYETPHPAPSGEVFHLNGALTEWAYQLTRELPLKDSEALQKRRAQYVGYPNAQKPPFVLKGDNLAGMTYWHGKLLNDWANQWTKYWTDGKGEFVSSAMEDTGTAQSLTYLTPTGKADLNRLMVLRTASNYTMQPPGVSAAESLLSEHGGEGYSGLSASVEDAYQVGSKVVDEIVTHWDQYKDHVPSAP